MIANVTSLKPPASFGLDAELLDLEAAPLRVARERAVEVAGPDRGLVAADALADLEDHVLAVRRIGRRERDAQLLFERLAALLELGHELAQVAVVARRLEVVVHLPPLRASLCGPSSSFSRRPAAAASRWSL